MSFILLICFLFFFQIILEEREQQKLREQEDMARVYEEKISAIREENQSAIQQLTREKQTELNNAKNRFETELETRAEESRRALDALRASHKVQGSCGPCERLLQALFLDVFQQQSPTLSWQKLEFFEYFHEFLAKFLEFLKNYLEFF